MNKCKAFPAPQQAPFKQTLSSTIADTFYLRDLLIGIAFSLSSEERQQTATGGKSICSPRQFLLLANQPRQTRFPPRRGAAGDGGDGGSAPGDARGAVVSTAIKE